jgi:hypothetical protein
LWRNPKGGIEERHWCGRVEILGDPGDVQFERGSRKRFGVVPTPRLWRAYVGLAGFVGELVARDQFSPLDVSDSFQSAFDDGSISEADLVLIRAC